MPLAGLHLQLFEAETQVEGVEPAHGVRRNCRYGVSLRFELGHA